MKTITCILSVAAFVFSVAVHAQNWTSGIKDGGSNNQIATDVAELSGGGKIVAGRYIGGTTFGTGNTLNHYFSFPTAIPNGFIVNYSNTNNVLWATRIVSAAGVFISSVTTSSDGHIYVCGSYANPCEFYSAGNPNATIPDTTLQMVMISPTVQEQWGFIAKYTNDGNLVWAKRGLGAGEIMTGVAVSEDGSQLVATGKVTFPFPTSTVTFGSYVLWINPSTGSTIRSYNYSDDTQYNYVHKTGLCIDHLNNVIVSGHMEGTSYAVQGAAGNISVTSNAIRSSIYAKYSSSGNLLWARATRANISDPNSTPSSLIVDANNNIYIAGWAYIGSNGYDLQFPTATSYLSVTIPPTVANNGYIVKLNPNGYAVWTSRATNTTPGIEAISLANGKCNTIYACINTTANPSYIDAFGTMVSPTMSSQGLVIVPINTNGQLLNTTPWIVNGVSPTRAKIASSDGSTLQCISTINNNVTIQTTSGSQTITPTPGSNDIFLGSITYGAPAPTVTFPEQLEACEGSSIVLNAAVTGGTSTFTYTWSVFDIALGNYVTLGTSMSPTFSVHPAVYGSYIIQIFNARVLSFQLTVTDNCSAIIASDNQTVLLKPGILFSQVSGVDVCYKSQITAPNAVFSVNAQNVNSFLWQYSSNGGLTWTPCGAGYSGVNTATLTVISPTALMNNYLFKCKLGGCPSSMETNPALLTVTPCPMRPYDKEKNGSSTDQIVLDAKLSLYPNPATTTLEVVFENNAFSENESIVSEAYILDMTGRKVREISFATGRNTVDVSNLQNGMYSFVVQTNGKVIDQQKFIVAH